VKITDVRITRRKMPRVDPAWRTASYADNSVTSFILEIDADGLTGIGGTAGHPRSMPADTLEAQLSGPVKTALLGADALRGNAIRAAIRQANLDARALIAADLALYDLIGKAAKLPCHALWGGASRASVLIDRMVGIKAPDDLVAHVGQLLEQGITHMKVKVGTGVNEDVERVRALRRAFAERITIGIDGNGAYTPDEAIDLSHALAPYNVHLIEQPINYRDLDGLARVTAASPIPIMADQCVEDAKTALAVCQRKAAHVISVKLSKMGSIDECRRVFDICAGFGVRVHLGGSAGPAVVDIAAAHLAATCSMVDEDCEVGEFQALSDEPTVGAVVKNGFVEIGNAPGWGLSLAR
jgi:L-alanine-DL-glutamate epimerase-like enolase superfamily enzyme